MFAAIRFYLTGSDDGATFDDIMRDSMSNVHNATKLHFRRKSHLGTIPNEIGQLTNLKSLDLAQNQFYGRIPNSIGQCVSLEYLDVQENQLDGTIPNGISSCKRLKTLVLSKNNLSGRIPFELFRNCTMLENCYCALNHFSGQIPLSVSYCSHLRELNLSSNGLSGFIPPELGQCSQLTGLQLQHNRLEGRIPEELFQCRELKDLFLQGNKLSGEIPSLISQCRSLRTVNVSQNKLTGEIPDFSRCPELRYLQLNNNKLCGNIPSGLAHCRKLNTLDFSCNNLCGNIPEELIACSELTRLYVQNNNLSGKIALSIQQAFEMISVNIDNNRFNCLLSAALNLSRWSMNDAFEEASGSDAYIPESYDDYLHGGGLSTEVLLLSRQLKGVKLDRYEIIEVLGNGNHGSVFRCQVDVGGEKKEVALKLIYNFNEESTTTLRQRNENEYKILLSLTEVHPNIVQFLVKFFAEPTQEMIEYIQPSIRDLFVDVNHITKVSTPKLTLFFALQYHPYTLAGRLKELGTDIHQDNRGFKYCLHCARALHFLHYSKIVHRDIKDVNILVSRHDVVVLADFGEAIVVDSEWKAPASALKGGNFAYSAPDVLTAMNRNDLVIDFSKQSSWELGLLMYKIVIGGHPFSGYPFGYEESDRKVTVPLIEPNFLAEILPTYPIQFSELITSLLINNTEQRTTIAEALATLESLNERYFNVP